jgi:hypothetical protein
LLLFFFIIVVVVVVRITSLRYRKWLTGFGGLVKVKDEEEVMAKSTSIALKSSSMMMFGGSVVNVESKTISTKKRNLLLLTMAWGRGWQLIHTHIHGCLSSTYENDKKKGQERQKQNNGKCNVDEGGPPLAVMFHRFHQLPNAWIEYVAEGAGKEAHWNVH